MQEDYTVLAPVAIHKDMLKHVVRVLGGGWLKSNGRDEGVVTEADESITLQVVDPATVSAPHGAMAVVGAVRVSPRRGPSAGIMALNIARMLARRWDGVVLGAPMPCPRPAFVYSEGPVEEMSDAVDGEPICSLCGQPGLCFTLEYADCPDLDEEAREEAVGCVQCLKADRFGWKYRNYEDETALTIPASAFEEMQRTPDFVSWQGSLWLTHCNDFMVYLGKWRPQDFHDRSPSGDGRDLFMQMTVSDDQYWWDKRARPDERGLESWYCSYYAFRCRHCGKLRGYCDFP